MVSIKRTKNGKRWTFRIDIGDDTKTGKRKQKSFTFDKKRDAEAALDEIRSKVREGTFFMPSGQAFSEYIYQWLEVGYKGEVRKNTYAKALNVVNAHLNPYFGGYRLKDIQTYHIDMFYHKKLESGLSLSYVRVMHNVLSVAFGKAATWRLIHENPVKGATRLRESNTERKVWHVEEISQFLQGVTKLQDIALYTTAIYTGMRRSEVLGMCWKDINFTDGIIHVRRRLMETDDGFALSELKTKASIRDIVVTSKVLDVLKKHKEVQESMPLSKQDGFGDLVFCTSKGTPIYARNLLRSFYKIINKTGVKKISFHDLRHTHATILMNAGVNPRVVADRLGHADVKTTLNLYTHVDRQAQRNAANRFAGKLEDS